MGKFLWGGGSFVRNGFCFCNSCRRSGGAGFFLYSIMDMIDSLKKIGQMLRIIFNGAYRTGVCFGV